MVCLRRSYHFNKFFKGCLPEILLGPFLNIFGSYISHKVFGTLKLVLLNFRFHNPSTFLYLKISPRVFLPFCYKRSFRKVTNICLFMKKHLLQNKHVILFFKGSAKLKKTSGSNRGNEFLFLYKFSCLLQLLFSLTSVFLDFYCYIVLSIRSSHPEVFCKKDDLRNFVKFTKTPVPGSLF